MNLPRLLCLPADSMDSLERLGVASFIWEHYAPSGVFERIVFCFLGNEEARICSDASSLIRVFRRRWGNALPLRALFYVIRVPYFIIRLIPLILRERIDVVRARSAGYNALAGVLAAGLTGRPSAISVHVPHALDRECSGQTGLAALEEALYERLSLRLAHRVYGVSTAMRDYAISMGTAPHRARVLHNRVDVGKFRRRNPELERRLRHRLGIQSQDRALLTVGRLVPQKDPITLLRALRILVNRDRSYRLVVIGIGKLRQMMDTFIAQSGLSAHVRFEDNVKHDDLPSYLHIADAFVLPALYEGFGIVLIEAQAAGTPIVTTEISGTADVVSRENALIVPVRSPDALADAVEKVFSCPDEARRRSRQGERDVRRFDEDRVKRDEINHYKEMLSSRFPRDLGNPSVTGPQAT